MTSDWAVVDLFSGPGGLAEGFAAFRTARGHRPFRLELSIENEPSAHRTLHLRTFLRQFEGGFPQAYYDFLNGERDRPDFETLHPREWAAAGRIAQRLTLGDDAAREAIDMRLETIRKRYDEKVILIGGPPCQAYSLVGRARNQAKPGYIAEEDGRHFLYREYVRILRRLRPAAFVMENVKGILSSSVGGHRVFGRILEDRSTSPTACQGCAAGPPHRWTRWSS